MTSPKEIVAALREEIAEPVRIAKKIPKIIHQLGVLASAARDVAQEMEELKCILEELKYILEEE
jgi:hypothetical protein